LRCGCDSALRQGAFADEDEVAEVLASHYLAAFEAAPEADDAPAVRAKAGEMLARAGERAGSLGAPEEGGRYYAQAAALSDAPALEAELLGQAGRLALQANELVEARAQLERALALHTESGDVRAAARASAGLADVDIAEGRLDDGATRLEQAVAQLEEGSPSSELAAALAQLGRTRVLAGHSEAAAAPLEQALTLAERLQLPEVFVQALTSKAIGLLVHGRLAEARILLEAAADRAHAEQLYASALRAENNLAVVLEASDRHAETLELCERSIALARRRGDRRWESVLRTGTLIHLFLLGRWDEALTVAAEEEPFAAAESARASMLAVALIHCERGDLDGARALLTAAATLRDSDNPQSRAGYAAVEARMLRGKARHADALAAAERALATRGELSITDMSIKLALVEACEAALALPDLAKAEHLLASAESLDPGELTPVLHANALRLRARLDTAHGNNDHVEEHFRSAASLCREFGLTFHLALTQLEHAEWLTAQGRTDDAQPLLTEARETFEQLAATPWLERTTRLSQAAPAHQAATAGP
jgi:tetratricopeptide (TPR) repeat protein